jgi:hypothetical protein
MAYIPVTFLISAERNLDCPENILLHKPKPESKKNMRTH